MTPIFVKLIQQTHTVFTGLCVKFQLIWMKILRIVNFKKLVHCTLPDFEGTTKLLLCTNIGQVISNKRVCKKFPSSQPCFLRFTAF